MANDLGLTIGESYVLHTPSMFARTWAVEGKETVCEAFYQGENHGRLSFNIPSIGNNGVTLTAGNRVLEKRINGEVYLKNDLSACWSRKEMAA